MDSNENKYQGHFRNYFGDFGSLVSILSKDFEKRNVLLQGMQDLFKNANWTIADKEELRNFVGALIHLKTGWGLNCIADSLPPFRLSDKEVKEMLQNVVLTFPKFLPKSNPKPFQLELAQGIDRIRRMFINALHLHAVSVEDCLVVLGSLETEAEWRTLSSSDVKLIIDSAYSLCEYPEFRKYAVTRLGFGVEGGKRIRPYSQIVPQLLKYPDSQSDIVKELNNGKRSDPNYRYYILSNKIDVDTYLSPEFHDAVWRIVLDPKNIQEHEAAAKIVENNSCCGQCTGF